MDHFHKKYHLCYLIYSHYYKIFTINYLILLYLKFYFTYQFFKERSFKVCYFNYLLCYGFKFLIYYPQNNKFIIFYPHRNIEMIINLLIHY